ncbi:MAG: hypothetical protein GY858_05520 [Candidatus Omnitrophica bacterium]|nr:hypothetical protein [Candidatus Omnitrophota bacterium]
MTITKLQSKVMAEMGRKGGKMSRRTLTSEQAKKMVKIRESKRKGGDEK